MLNVRSIYRRFPLNAGFLHSQDRHIYAVNGVSLSIGKGQVYGLVGESGSGKTTLARMIVGLVPTDIGAISFEDSKGNNYSPQIRKQRPIYQNLVRYVFQDPSHSLNPRLSVRRILIDGLRYTKQWKGRSVAENSLIRVLRQVDLDESILSDSPVALSGGQRQRIALARALLTRPELLICDEVLSSLDAPIRKRTLDIVLKLRHEYQLSVLFISHDLNTVLYASDRVGVLYQGCIVEEADAAVLREKQIHPYSQRLSCAVPQMGKMPKILAAPPSPISRDFFMQKYRRALSAKYVANQKEWEEVQPGHFVDQHTFRPS